MKGSEDVWICREQARWSDTPMNRCLEAVPGRRGAVRVKVSHNACGWASIVQESLRDCDRCGRLTDAGEYPDWENGLCPDCEEETR